MLHLTFPLTKAQSPHRSCRSSIPPREHEDSSKLGSSPFSACSPPGEPTHTSESPRPERREQREKVHFNLPSSPSALPPPNTNITQGLKLFSSDSIETKVTHENRPPDSSRRIHLPITRASSPNTWIFTLLQGQTTMSLRHKCSPRWRIIFTASACLPLAIALSSTSCKPVHVGSPVLPAPFLFTQGTCRFPDVHPPCTRRNELLCSLYTSSESRSPNSLKSFKLPIFTRVTFRSLPSSSSSSTSSRSSPNEKSEADGVGGSDELTSSERHEFESSCNAASGGLWSVRGQSSDALILLLFFHVCVCFSPEMLAMKLMHSCASMFALSWSSKGS
mmetsp:Transcript_27507/g.62390  ORF Transcript_27507/g.62390 Transcript_27507/m.62390 type:complete len:333 (-) Transcript_27507:464-1462(-)